MKALYLLFLTACIFFLSEAMNACADQTYTIQKGDSLYKISKKFRVGIDKIKEANNIDSINLKPGVKISIPSNETTSKKTKSDVQASKSLNKKENSTKTSGSVETIISSRHNSHNDSYHTVKKGDTLSSISREHSISIDEIKELNNINNKGKLRVGQKLVIKKTGPKTYTVRKGDNILKIAKKFNKEVEELIEINELESIELKTGQKLLVESWVDEPISRNNYTAIISEAKMTEEIKSSSALPDIASLSVRERISLFAQKMLDIPYKFGGNTFMGIDCSAYVQKVFGFMDMPLPRTAREQFTIGEPVSREDLSIGDLVFFRTYASFPSHVGIYLGNNLFIHASSKNRKVTIDSLDRPYYIKRFIGAKRLFLDDEDAKEAKEKS